MSRPCTVRLTRSLAPAALRASRRRCARCRGARGRGRPGSAACDRRGRRPAGCERPSRRDRCTARWAGRDVANTVRSARQDRHGGLGGPQLRVQQPLGRIVEDRDERLLARRGAGAQPRMRGCRRGAASPRSTPAARAAAGADPARGACAPGRPPGAPASRSYRTASPRGPGGRSGRSARDGSSRRSARGTAADALHLERRGLAPRGHTAGDHTGPPRRPRLEPCAPAPQAARLHAENLRGLQPRQRATQCPHDDFLLTFMARSTAAAARTIGTSFGAYGLYPDRSQSGQFTCSRERTDHVQGA